MTTVPKSVEDEIKELREELAKQGEELAKQGGAATVWRALGGIAGTAAVALGLSALSLASQAAVDHERVNRLEETSHAVGDRMERLIEAQTRTTAQLEQMQETLSELRTDVRQLRAEEGQRR